MWQVSLVIKFILCYNSLSAELAVLGVTDLRIYEIVEIAEKSTIFKNNKKIL